MKKIRATKNITISDEIKIMSEIVSEYHSILAKKEIPEAYSDDDGYTTLLCNCICNHLKINNFMVYFKVLDYSHYVLAVEINNKYYILDLTYAKYFNKKEYKVTKKNQNRTFNGGLDFFVNRTEEGRIFARKLIRKGYFECTLENMKIYCDSFILVNYNKNKKNKDLVYETKITGEEYFSNMILRKANSYNNVDNNNDRGEVDVKIKQKK